jgi:hypothetical protein
VTRHTLGRPITRAEAMARAARRAVSHLRLRFHTATRESTRGDTEHLLRSPANAARLRAALESSRAGEGLRVTVEDLRTWADLGRP